MTVHELVVLEYLQGSGHVGVWGTVRELIGKTVPVTCRTVQSGQTGTNGPDAHSHVGMAR